MKELFMSQENESKIVITGASGFLGNNLIKALKVEGKYSIHAFSSHGDELQSRNKDKYIQYHHKKIIFSGIGKDILKDAIIINCAFPRNSTGVGLADGLKYIQEVFLRSRQAHARAVINISSQSVYSQKREEIATEVTPVCLESPYAVGKYSTELMLDSVCQETDVLYTNLRMASLIGPGFDQRIVNRFVKQALQKTPIQVVRSKQLFGFLDIEDAVNALISLIETPIETWKTTYTVGNGKGYSIEEIAESVEKVFKKNDIPFMNISTETGDGVGNTGVSYRLLHEDTGFAPTLDLKDSIQKILIHMREQ